MQLGTFSVSLAVKDLAASRAFYEKLGFAAFAGAPSQNWLILKNGDHVICLFQGMFERNMLTFNPGWDSDARPVEAFTDVRELQRRLKAVPWLKEATPPCIYAVGGGFRAIAKLHMIKTEYPLNIVHEYVMNRRALNQTIEKLVSMKPEEVAELPGISAKRASTLIPTAVVLQQLLEVTSAPQVMFSVSGIREGFFYDLLDKEQQAEDPLIASAMDLAALIGRQGTYGKELHAWMTPLFASEPMLWQRLRLSLCVLSELAWAIDPNFRASWAYHRIIQSSLKGMDHKERLMLALALYHRYQPKFKGEKRALKLLDERERLWARCVGLAANLAFQLSGGRSGNLHHARLTWHDGQVQLALDEEAAPLRTETVEKRVEMLSEALRGFTRFVL